MSAARMIGVDVGGTFTDVFFLDEAAGTVRVAKVPTTRPDQSGGFLDGIGHEVSDLSTIAAVIHGTTAGTNALLERKGAPVGVITTAGLRDVLEMRRRDRPATWGLRGDFVPVVPRERRIEVPERTLASGEIRERVDPDAVRDAARRLLEDGCKAVAILFANSYANPENEARAAEIVRAVWPNDHVAASSEILPEIREFERFSTAALNAYLQPEVSGYLDRLDAALRDGGFAGKFLIVQSNGGVMDVGTASARPIRTALSGPAAGVIAAAHIAGEAGLPDIVTGDMGGTSFDVSLIAGGEMTLAAETAVDFGMVVRTPMIEITTIGAGGGSIVWVDEGGLLNVGPESAGSDPGPVAYGQGNDRPTVTDANVVLGRIDPDAPIGGKLDRLDVEAAGQAIDKHIGAPLGLDRYAAAEAVLRVANSRMAGALRLVSIERGYDPGRFAFMPFGGGGALHACAMMDEVGIGRSIVPRYPGVTSAMGAVIADMRQDFVQTLNSDLGDLDHAALRSFVSDHVSTGMAVLDESGVRFDTRDVRVELDMSYRGQTHAVPVPVEARVGPDGMDLADPDAIARAFDDAYRAAYGRILESGTRRITNVRTAVIGVRPKFDLATLAPAETVADKARRAGRRVHFGDTWQETAIYDRLALPAGAEIAGPAILTQPDTTILIEPGFVGKMDRHGNTIITREGAG